MKQEVLKYFEDIYMIEVAMILFMLIFIIVVVKTWFDPDKDFYRHLENLPLEEDVK